MTERELVKYFQCPYCNNYPLIFKTKTVNCSKCQSVFKKINGVFVFIDEDKLNFQEQNQKKYFNFHYKKFKNEYKLENWQESMLQRVFVEENVKTYLDIGCGATGYTVIEAAKRKNWLAFGTDISLIAVIKARNLAKKMGVANRTVFVVCSAEHLPFRKKIFDYVSLISSLEHIKNDVMVTKKIYQILKPAGLVFVCVPNTYKKILSFLLPIYRIIDYKVGHLRHYSIDELTKIMEKGGHFRLEKFFYNGHLIKLIQLLLEKFRLINNKLWWAMENIDINNNTRGLQLNAFYRKI